MTFPATPRRPGPTGVSVAGVGTALPGEHVPGAVIDNERLAELNGEACRLLAAAGGPERPASTVDFPWQRIGIRRRRILDRDHSVRDLAIAAAHRALRAAGVTAADVGAVIVSTVTPDRVVPAVATSVHDALGLPNTIPSFDVSLGCNGFLAALEVAANAIRAGADRPCALVVGAETMTRVLDASDRNTCTIFGDGAGAVVLRRSDEDRVARVGWRTFGDAGDLIEIAAPDDDPVATYRFVARRGDLAVAPDARSQHRVRMEGKRVFKDMVRTLPSVVAEYLATLGRTVDDVDRFVFHQANQKMVDAVARAIVPDRPTAVLSNIEEVGNTTSASIPLLIDDAVRGDRIRAGDRVLLVGFGTGYSIGASLLEWS